MALVKRLEKGSPLSAAEYDAVVTQVEDNKEAADVLQGQFADSQVTLSFADLAAATAYWTAQDAASNTPSNNVEIYLQDVNQFWKWDSGETAKAVLSRANIELKNTFDAADEVNPSTMKATADYLASETDATPTLESDNLVRSGGSFESILLNTTTQSDITGALTNNLVNADGSLSSSANWRATSIIEITANTFFKFNATEFPASPYATIIVYDELDVIQEVIYKNDVRLSTYITFDYDFKIRCSARQTGSDIIELIKYTSNSNELTTLITKVDANTTKTDVTYLDETTIDYVLNNAGYINSSGNFVANVNQATSDFVDITKLNSNFFTSFDFNLFSLSCSPINFYDSAKTWLSTESLTYGTENYAINDFEIPKPSGAKFVRVTSSENYVDKDFYSNTKNLQIAFDKLGNPNRMYDFNVANFGDSITWYDGNLLGGNINGGTGGNVICIGYINHLATTLGFESYDNQGASGKSITTENWVQISAYDYTGIDLATIAHGTNDFKLNRVLGSFGLITDTSFDTDTFYGAYRHTLDAIIASNSDCEIVLLTPIQRDNAGYTIASTNTAGFKLIDYVNAIKEIGQMYSLKVVDLYSESGINFKNIFDFSIDGLHPNNAGQLKMGEAILREIL